MQFYNMSNNKVNNMDIVTRLRFKMLGMEAWRSGTTDTPAADKVFKDEVRKLDKEFRKDAEDAWYAGYHQAEEATAGLL